MADNTSQVGASLVGSLWVGAGADTVGSSGGATGSITVPSLSIIFPSGLMGDGMFGLHAVPSISSTITGGTLAYGMTGLFSPVPSIRAVFPGGALLSSATGIKIFVQGVDRTAYVGMPISGSLSVGSTGNATLPLVNVGPHGTYLSAWQPSKFDEVQIYIDTYRLFGGYVNTVERTLYQDSNGLAIYSVNCWSYAAILDRVIIGTHFEVYNGALANIIMYNLVSRYLADRGYVWGGSGNDTGPFFPAFSINWWSFAQVNQYVCSKANWNAYVDQYKVLRMFGITSTSRPGPFTLTKDNSKFETMKPTRGGEYFNYVIVRNSQNLGSIWADDFAGDVNADTGFYAPLTAALTSKPAVYVNGVAQVVVDPTVYGRPWDFYWLTFGVVRNPMLAPLSGSDVVTVKYPLDIDYVVIRKDDAEIATYGKVMKVVEIKDITTLTDMGLIADGELAKGIEDITTIEAQTDIAGIEPGQIVSVLADPIDDDFMVESVSFTQLGPDLMRFTVQGSNANVQRRNSGPALFQKLLNTATQARDRVQTPVGFALWTSVGDPANNPGSTTGIIAGAIRTMPVSGVAVKCTLNFQSVQTGTPTTVDVIIDVLMDGVSIFPAGNPAKMIYPAGSTTPQTLIIFANSPQEINGHVVTLNCLQADPRAYDGVLELTVQG